MKLTVFNGSPRGKNSNTKILMDHFARGFTDGNDNQVEVVYLNQIGETEKHLEKFKTARYALLAFPLYTDAMPGIVKHFIEALKPLCNQQENSALGFVIQSGFPEPAHSRYVARYMERLAQRLGCPHLGTIIRGGVEGIQVMPPWMTRKLSRNFYMLGKKFALDHKFDGEIGKKLAPRDTLSFMRLLMYRLMDLLGMTRMYWNKKLKENKSFDQRFARPFKD